MTGRAGWRQGLRPRRETLRGLGPGLRRGTDPWIGGGGASYLVR